jgi:hypothetical protein
MLYGSIKQSLRGVATMKRVNAILCVCGLGILALSLPSWAQVRQQTQTTTVSGTVESIDQNPRAVHIKTDAGKFETIDVPQSARRFDELKVGDKVSVTYNNTVTARLKQPGEAAVGADVKSSNMGQSAQPGGTAVLHRTITATVSGIDRSASSISFVGPNGWKYSRRVADPTILDKVKVGDQVDFTWDTDLAVSVN